MKDLIAQLEGIEPDGEMYDARVKVLSEYVTHHVKEEQNERFPTVKASSLDLVELGARMAAHSGLPYGSAHDIPSAMVAMKGGRSGMPGLKNLPDVAATLHKKVDQAVPRIVFHGDRDHTVQHSNGAHIVRQARDAHGAHAERADLLASTQSGVAPGGQRYSRTVHADAEGQGRIESWTLHGAGHAWSGGHASGPYTDGHGPDASAEMVRFFMALPSKVVEAGPERMR